VRVGSVAAGAERQCAPAVLVGRFCAAPQLHLDVGGCGLTGLESMQLGAGVDAFAWTLL
jgi:hypothetical protein